VSVSRQDFPSPEELSRLVAKLANPALDLRACAELSAGQCEMRLQLGTLEIGVDQQWSRLEAVLTDLSLASAAE